MEFRNHNVRLPDGSETIPGKPLLSDTSVCRAAAAVFDAFHCRSVLDLGCNEGGHSAAFARDWRAVLGVEIRDCNLQRCRYLQAAGIPAQFERRSVWDITPTGSGRFDGVFCGGLLYHLETPRAFIRQLFELTQTVAIVDTHFADVALHPVFRLSDMTENEGLPGRWYREFDDDSFQQREAHPLASWENQRSFWILQPALVAEFEAVGFRSVLKLPDEQARGNHRGLFVLIK